MDSVSCRSLEASVCLHLQIEVAFFQLMMILLKGDWLFVKCEGHTFPTNYHYCKSKFR